MLNITATVQAVSIDYPGILLFEDKDLPGFPSKNSSEYEQELIKWGQIYKLPITPAIAKEIINKPANADQTIWQTMRDVIFVETLIKSINHLEGDYINKISTKDYTDSYAEKTYDRLNEVVKIWQNYDDFWNKAHSAMTNLILIHSNEKFYKEAKEKVGFLGSFAKGDLISPVTGFIQDKAIDFLCYGIEDLCSYTLKIASIKNAAGLYSLGTSLITDAIISFGIAQLESRPLGKFFALYYYTLKYKPELISSCPKLFLSDGTINKEEAQLEAIEGSCSNKDSFIMALLRPQTMTHTIDVGLVKSENAQMMRAIATSFAMLSQLRTLDTIKKEIVGYAYLSYLSNTMTYQQYIDVNDCEKIESGVTSNLQMHIPLIEHNGQKFWADFEAQTLGSDLYFSLKSYGTANIIITQCSQAATLSPSFLLHVPVARFGEQTLWADLQYIGNNLFKVIQYGFATVSAPTFNAVPSSPVVSPTTQTWKSTPQTIQVSANNAERIYCTLRTTDDGSEPAEPPEPTKESGQHDPCSKIEDSIKGNKGNFEFWGSSGKVKKIKVRFRGFNNQGYGVTSSSYQYTIDLRSSQITVPTIPTSSQTTGNWTTTPQFLSVSANNAERIYCMVEETNDGTIPNDPPIPSETSNDPCVQGGSFISGSSGQFQLWGETGKLENIKIRFRAWNQQGFSSVSPVYNYSIDLRNQQTITTPVINKRISVGGHHSCALTSAGGVKCWGNNASGQLGDGTTTDRKTPVSVEGLSSGVAAISAGHDHTCALTTAGAVKCWGYNIYGFLGDGSASPPTSPHLAIQTTPVLVQGLSSGVKAIAAGNHYTCALTNSGGVKCWGINGYATYNFSVLGDGTTMDRFLPVDVSGLSSGVVAIAAGHTHTCAVTNLGEIKCWGQNSYGQLGNGTTTNSTIPVTVSGLNNAISVSVGSNNYSCAVTNLGEVKCWGYNRNTTPTPTLVSNVNNAASITVGNTICALTSTGSAQCWGYLSSISPATMPNLSTGVAEISSRYNHGSNQYGQLGNGTTTDSATPVDVVGF